MILWLLLFVGIFVFAIAGVIYLIRGVHRFSFVSALSGKNRIVSWILSTLLIILPTVLLSLFLGYMNGIIILLHLALFWLLADFLFWIIRKCTKKIFRKSVSGIVAIAFTAIYLTIGWVQAFHVWETDYTFQTDKQTGTLRVGLIADSHVGTTFHADGLAKHLEALQAQQPDVVVVAGDFVDEDTTKEDMIGSCTALGNLQTPYGVYFVFGNHDKGLYSNGQRGYTGDDLVAELEKNGVTVLQDESVLIDDRFYLIGRQDLSEVENFNGSRASISDLVADLDQSKYKIVLDHQPRDYTAESAADVDLVLSGHTHGGQLIPLMQLANWFGIGGNDSTYGLQHRNLTDFIVTSGISDWAIKFKTGCKSEYVIIDINEK